MKLTDILFWVVLISIAAFYVIKGNDIHKEKIQIRTINQISNVEVNKTVELVK